MKVAASWSGGAASRTFAASSKRPARRLTIAGRTAADEAAAVALMRSRKNPITGGVSTDALSNTSERDVNGITAVAATAALLPGVVTVVPLRVMRNGRVT